MKKVLSVLLALCLLIGALPVFAGATADESDFDIYETASGAKAITGYHGPGGEVMIPNGINAILASAFDNGKYVTGLQLPESVNFIDTGALSGCTNLERMLILNPNIEIQPYAIPNCVKDIYFNGTKEQWENTYGYYTVPDSTTMHFNEETPLEEFEMDGSTLVRYNGTSVAVTIPSTVKTIGNGAFMNCSAVASVTIPVSVTYIGANAFENCTGLKDVYYEGTEAQWNKVEINNVESGNRYLHSAQKHFQGGSTPPAGFTDVKPGAYYENGVKWAIENNVTQGIGNGKFGPNNHCTRSQIVTFLWNAAGKPQPSTTQNSFSDVKSGDYYYDAVMWAVENNITQGTGNGKFSPNQTCTRAQAMALIWNAAGKPDSSAVGDPFTDLKPGTYYYTPVMWAVEFSITNGVGNGKFGTNDPCTRGQIVTFLYNWKTR